MVQQPRAVTYKVIFGYLLLIVLAAGAVFFIYNEILGLSRPGSTGKENEKILRISNTIASLYASEAIAREYMLSGADRDRERYVKATDSVHRQLDSLKRFATPSLAVKLDSIQRLLLRKKNSINDIVAYRSTAAWENTFRKAASEVHEVKDSIWSVAAPVPAGRRTQYSKLLEAFLSRRQLDSLSKMPLSNDSLTQAFDKAFSRLIEKDNRLRNRLYRKEQKMLEENRVISDQLRSVLSSLEKEFLDNTYRQLRGNQERINTTFNTIAWMGAAGVAIILILMWIIVRDLSTSQKYRRQLEVLNAENESLLKAKSMLMATVTHDLQTPLGSILGFNNLLQGSGVSAKQQQYLDNIRESAEYILRLVNDLLDFSKIENNRLTVEKSNANLNQLIENTCRNLRPMAENKGIELSCDIDDGLSGSWRTDAYRLRQVLTNIIGNAIKFTAEGSVEVTAKKEGKQILIAVLDTGIGIAAHQQTNVFNEYTQADGSISKKFGGTGLGLSISKRIVEMLGGSIRVESEPGQGSIFTITLPAEEAIADSLPAPHDTDAAAPGHRYRILVVDDDATQLALMKELLSQQGMEVVGEANPGNVPQLLETREFDLILSDVQMPVMDGFMLVQKLRRHSKASVSRIPVIALSGRRDLNNDYYTDMGFSACHPKPIHTEELLTLIQSVLGNVSRTERKTPSVPPVQQNAAKLYNLDSLSRFTQGDTRALHTILTTFIGSAKENCSVLQAAAAAGDNEWLAQTAHKMIPMLRQMEVHTIADLLAPVEDHALDMSRENIIEYIDGICSSMALLCDALQGEMD